MTDRSPAAARRMTWEETQHLTLWVVDQLLSSMKGKIAQERTPDTLQLIQERFALLCKQKNIHLPGDETERLYERVVNELVGLGPIEMLIQDNSVTEVMVNGPDQVYVERDGKIMPAEARFLNDDHVMRIINKIIEPLQRSIDRQHPMVDARLLDGSRVNAIISPCAIDGPSVTIRKFRKERYSVDDLIQIGTLTEAVAKFLEACVVSRLNVIISGGTGSGKTTLLNVLSGFIPDDERIVTIEDAAELKLNQSHVVRLETAAADQNGNGRVTVRDLVINSLRMRPDRIVVGECRGSEALDMLQAMNTGHDGSLTTVHANTPRDTLSRLETLVMMAGMDLPLQVVRRQITSAMHLIVQQARLRDGSRKVTHVTEVQGMEGDTVILQPVFLFKEEGEEDGKVLGQLRPCGIRPSFVERLAMRGFDLPPAMFVDASSANGALNGAAGGRRRRRDAGFRAGDNARGS